MPSPARTSPFNPLSAIGTEFHAPLAVILSSRCQSSTLATGALLETLAEIVTTWLVVGVTGEWPNAVSWRGGFATKREFCAPGVPRLFGIGTCNVPPHERSQLCATRRGDP